jgi:hypothetical protein
LIAPGRVLRKGRTSIASSWNSIYNHIALKLKPIPLMIPAPYIAQML